ncbi:cupredoxin domain-containing protein [Zavarzinella formosa]|uniref:hypothetical protein n=1 Tax=Zavarzinella formosa TaxID=360055 RepID=UPI000309457E|nr:hypothetical protein [Zavarzinella formosa]
MVRTHLVMMLFLATSFSLQAAPLRETNHWVTVKGKIVWDEAKGEAPKQIALVAGRDAQTAAMDTEFLSEEWVVNAKSGGIKNVVVWLAPEPSPLQLDDLKNKKLKVFPSFTPNDINPQLLKPANDSVVIEQHCCRFIPHVMAAQEGQKLIIKNTAPVPHNAKYFSLKNGEVNVLIRAKDEYALPKQLVAEKQAFKIDCAIHPWMAAFVRVFDHPYFAVSDANGNFEIKDAPTLKGKLRMFVWHHDSGFSGGSKGFLGTTLEVKPGTMNLGAIKFEVPN